MNNVRVARAKNKTSQFSLRLMTGIHQSRISLIENGLIKATTEEQKKIAAALLPEKKIEEGIIEIFGEARTPVAPPREGD